LAIIARPVARLGIGGYDRLVDAPGDLDLDVGFVGEQRVDACALSVGEQVVSGVQGPPGAVERVVGVAAVSVQVLLDAAATAVQGITGQAGDVEGIHHRRPPGSSSLVAVLNPANPSIATTSRPSR
jgi:hypothetical protein